MSRPQDNPSRDFPATRPGDPALQNERPERPGSEYNPPAIIGMCCGLLGLVVLQIALAPAAIVLGAYGVHYSQKTAVPTKKLAVAAYVLGIVDGLVWLVLASVWGIRFFPL